MCNMNERHIFCIAHFTIAHTNQQKVSNFESKDFLEINFYNFFNDYFAMKHNTFDGPELFIYHLVGFVCRVDSENFNIK